MNITIRKTEPVIPISPTRDAHFSQIHAHREREDDEGNSAYALDFDELAADLVFVKDSPEALDTLVTFIANSGVHVKWDLLAKGATTAKELFEDPNDAPELDMTRRCYHDGFMSAHLPSIVKMLAYHHGREDKEKAQASIALIESQLANLGLMPNHARIKAEFCLTCGK